ncbi:hypothetical protein [Ochrobactrum sp. AN78]|uniref:hypothetical protein n=1 Tax=Ochrobactrum sp. AN78 TaxID=3039853 RepID=UPI002989F8DF|nr:hypothetical protein [Ochrobactrum sp. AN78]MDH7790703.1 hypothetical protein [Ochrobactrum sp. AN78]
MNMNTEKANEELFLKNLSEAISSRSANKDDVLRIMECPAIEIICYDGRVFKVYANGLTEGFPDGTIINQIPTMLSLVQAYGLEAVDERIPGYPMPDYSTD